MKKISLFILLVVGISSQTLSMNQEEIVKLIKQEEQNNPHDHSLEGMFERHDPCTQLLKSGFLTAYNFLTSAYKQAQLLNRALNAPEPKIKEE